MISAIFASWFTWGSDDDDDPAEELDEEEFSERDLRVRIFKAEQKINKIGQEIDKHQKQYRNLLQEGVDAPQHRRNVLAIKARMQKFKGQLKQVERKKSVRDLMQAELKLGHKEVGKLADDIAEEDSELAGALDMDEDEFHEQISDVQAGIQADMEEAHSIMQSLQMPGGSFEQGTTEEEEIMEEMAEGNVSVDELEFDSPGVVDETQETDWDEPSSWDEADQTDGF